MGKWRKVSDLLLIPKGTDKWNREAKLKMNRLKRCGAKLIAILLPMMLGNLSGERI